MIKLSGQDGLKWKALPLIHAGYRIIGKRWTDFYAWMLDRQERGNDIDKIMRRSPKFTGKEHNLYDLSVAPLHLELLQKAGLKPEHSILDFGCGFGRSAATLVPYLNPGNYVGTDLSAERIRLAYDYMDRLGLKDRRAEFHVSKRDNDLTFLGLKRFDVFFARSVFSHMPIDDVRVCFQQAHKVLKDDGVLIGDYIANDKFTKQTVKDFHFPEYEMHALAVESGFRYALLSDWNVGITTERRPDNGMARMMLLRKL